MWVFFCLVGRNSCSPEMSCLFPHKTNSLPLGFLEKPAFTIPSFVLVFEVIEHMKERGTHHTMIHGLRRQRNYGDSGAFKSSLTRANK